LKTRRKNTYTYITVFSSYNFSIKTAIMLTEKRKFSVNKKITREEHVCNEKNSDAYVFVKQILRSFVKQAPQFTSIN